MTANETLSARKRKGSLKSYITRKKDWKESGVDSWYEFDSFEEFVEKKLNKWDEQQLKIPTGKYQDRQKVISNYQQKFVEYIRQLCPKVIKELREFVPYFDSLLGRKKKNTLIFLTDIRMKSSTSILR